VPQNAYGDANGQTVFTHGVEMGVARAASRDLEQSTNALIDALAQGNPDLQPASRPRSVSLANRQGIATALSNRSATGGQEQVGVYTTFLSDGSLFYLLTIVPREEANEYAPAFQRVAQSLRLNDR